MSISHHYSINPTIEYEFKSINVTVNAKGRDLFKCESWNFIDENCSDEKWTYIGDLIPGQDYSFNIYNVTDPGYGETNSTVNILNKDNLATSYSENILDNTAGIVDVEFTLQNNAVETITIYDHDLSSTNNELYIQDNNDTDYDRAYSIDPSKLNFTNATVRVQANQSLLYKCVDWNFTLESCEGEWEYLMTATAGEYYNFTLNSTDPGFIEIQPDNNVGKDSFIRGGTYANNNYGTSDSIEVNGNSNLNAQRRTLIEFNLSSVPSGVRIIDASLNLYFWIANNANVQDHSVYRVTSSWVESEVTYNNRDSGNAWTSAGGDYDATVIDTVTGLSQDYGWKKWNITSVAESWNNGTYANYGIIIISSATGSRKRYYSSDYGTASLRPILNITYLDIQPPNVVINSPSSGAQYNISDSILINTTVTDNINVSNVFANVSWQSYYEVIELTNSNGDFYNATFTNTNESGSYTITIIANDTENVVIV
jgi:hypothetical protein